MTGVQTQIRRKRGAFVIRILPCIVGLFGPRHLSFLCCLRASAGLLPPALKNKWQATKRIVRTLTTESADLTYEQELLNSGKNSHPYKTNHSQLRRIGSPAPPFVTTGGKPTKRIVLVSGLSAAELTALRMKKSNIAPENKSFLQNESPRPPSYSSAIDKKGTAAAEPATDRPWRSCLDRLGEQYEEVYEQVPIDNERVNSQSYHNDCVYALGRGIILNP
jgi:hypothetical protein